MTHDRSTAPPIGGVALLERATGYTLGSLHLVTPAAMERPTPCRDWDLRALLAHMDDALVALQEAVDLACVDLDGSDGSKPISIGGHELPASVLTSAGALEIAVHGWDVAQACGRRRPIPPSLASELLVIAPFLVSEADRPMRFAPPVDLPSSASPSDKLIAYLGREPR